MYFANLSNWWNARRASFTLTTVIIAALILGFLASPIWGAVVTALSTAVLSCLTLAQAWQDREEQNRPRVVFYAHREGDDILFHATNIGHGAAFNVEVQLNRPIWYRVGETDWENVRFVDLRDTIGFMTSPIVMLAPSQTLTTLNRLVLGTEERQSETTLHRFIHSDGEYNNENNIGNVTYQDYKGRKFRDETRIGFAAFRNMKLITEMNRTKSIDDQ